MLRLLIMPPSTGDCCHFCQSLPVVSVPMQLSGGTILQGRFNPCIDVQATGDQDSASRIWPSGVPKSHGEDIVVNDDFDVYLF